MKKIEIQVPALGESITEATVAKWFIKKGEHINKVLKRFKRRVRNSQVLKEYRSRQSFVSNSSKKKDMMNKARYSQYMKDLEIS